MNTEVHISAKKEGFFRRIAEESEAIDHFIIDHKYPSFYLPVTHYPFHCLTSGLLFVHLIRTL